MSKFSEYIGSQFGNPRGVVGSVCCELMNIVNNAMYQNIISAMHRRIRFTEQSKVLDVGYGNGYLIKKLYKRCRPDIYGIDISEDMRLSAEKRNRKAVEAGKVHLTVGDCCRLEYGDDFFDAVTSVNTIYFWDDTLKGLREILRTLKPGGVFYNAVYTKEFLQKLSYTKTGFKFFEREDYISLGKSAGFSEVEVLEVAKGRSLVVEFRK